MTRETPAAKAVRLLGAKRIAAKCDLTTNAVWRWASDGQGRIPAKHQLQVLALADEMGVSLTAAELVGAA